MTTNPGIKTPDSRTAAITMLPWLSWCCLLFAGVLVLYPLSYTWNALPTYAFGWWVPLLAMILFSERWATRSAPEPAERPVHVVRFILVWGILFLGLRMALEASLASRPLLTGCTMLYLGALFYWLWIYGGSKWVRHFAFPICFLLLCVPWPTQIEMPLVQGLERFNAWMVAQFLVIFLGIPAQSAGNVISLPNCVLGVKDACSGIRSLQAAIMIGFLLGELYRFSWPRRGRLVLLAIALALVGNFLRTLFLALMASFYGVEVMTQWHDKAGAFILVFTSVTVWLVCHFLRQRDPLPSPSTEKISRPASFSGSGLVAQRVAFGILAAAVLAVLVTQVWYAWRSRDATHYPTWTALSSSTGQFHEMDIGKDTYSILKYDAGREVEWKGTQGWDWLTYWFRYHPNPWGAAVFQSHNPDQCLPAAGFEKVANHDPFDVQVQDIHLHVWPEQFSLKGTPIFVFWIVYADQSNFPLEQAVLAPHEGYGAKLIVYLESIWQGRRGTKAEMESLETILTGPEGYPDAKAAYIEELPKMIVPDSSQSASSAKSAAAP